MSAYLVKKDVKLVLKDIGKLQGLRPGLIVTFIHCTEQWVKQLVQAEQEYPLPLSFTTAFCGVANDIGAGTRILGVEVKASTFIIYIKDNPSGTVQLIAIGR